MIPHAYAMHSQNQAQDLAAAILSAASPPQIAAACSAVDAFLRRYPGDQSRPFFSIAFPSLLCRLFGFDSASPPPPRSSARSTAWLDQADPDLAARLFGLLSPGGILLSSISAVDRHSLVRFVFPAERLPEWMRYALQSERLSALLPDLCPLFRSRVKEDAAHACQLHLNVFEYYVFWFAYHPVCRGKSENSDAAVIRKNRRFRLDNWTSSWPSLSGGGSHPGQKKGCGLYMRLLCAYLRAFVPRYGLGACQPYRSSLFHYTSSDDDSAATRAEFLVYTMIQFWMVDNDFSPLPASLCSSFGVALPFQALLSEAPPTAGLGEVLTLVVRYLNSCLGDRSDVYGQVKSGVGPGWSSSTSYNTGKSRSMTLSYDCSVDSWNSLIQRPLYRFILRTFLYCPIGTSTRNAGQVFTVWMSYMEPWKITPEDFLELEVSPGGEKSDALGKGKSLVQDRNNGAMERGRLELEYSAAWQGYITSNYLFYNSLVVHFLGFAHRFLHGNVETIIQMVSKVLNILTSSRDLMDLLRRTNAAYHAKPSGPSLSVSDVVYRCIPVIREQLQDWENGLCESDADGSFLHEHWNCDLRLFNNDENGAHQLLQLLILRAESELASVPTNNMVQNLQSLDTLRAHMDILFGGPVRISPSPIITRVAGTGEGTRDEGFTPKHPGIGKARWADVRYRGDWMRRPISDSEVAWLVRLLVWLSDWLNHVLSLNQGVSNVSNDPIYIKLPPNDRSTAGGTKEAMWMLLALVGSWMGLIGRALLHFMRERGMRINLRPLASKKLVLVVLVYAVVTILRKFVGGYLVL